MKSWISIICLCCVKAPSAYSAALPTQDERVIFRDDHPSKVTIPNDSNGMDHEPIQITEMRVHSEIALRYARTSVITHVYNADSRPQQATFRMLLPDTAFISNFTMFLNGIAYKANIKEKKEASQIYSNAVSQGISAAHISAKARDSNHFTVSVNVEGNSTAIFDLRYEDFLVRRNGLYNHAINLHPGATVPKMEIVVHIKESQKITKLFVPEVRTGNEIDATENDAQNLKAGIQYGITKHEVMVNFTPDLIEQGRLAEIYEQKLKERNSFEYHIGYDHKKENDHDDIVLGQFVIQYDVEQSNKGEILVHDLKEAEEVLSMWNMPSTKLVPPARATPENIAKAKVIVSELEVSGATNIFNALEIALNLVKQEIHHENKTALDSEIVDSNITTNSMEGETISSKQLEPIIIFLTDGNVNKGETSTARITTSITKKNSGHKRASLYTLAFGEHANRIFLRELSLRNNGFMRHIYVAADAALQLYDFYRQVSSPLLSHVQFLYPRQQIKEGSVSRSNFHAINAGSEVAVVGQIAEDVSEIDPVVLGLYGSDGGVSRKHFKSTPKVTVNRTKNEHLPLERLWAYLTIKQLLDNREDNEAEKKALDIALKYTFVTPLTSLVVTAPTEYNYMDKPPSIVPAIQPSYAHPWNDVGPAVTDLDAKTVEPLGSTVTTTTTTTTTTPAPTTVSSRNYHLEGFEWTSSLLNASADALTVRGANSEQVFLKLTTDIDTISMCRGKSHASTS
ncbi:inter-alpha-trypsin inhibitor heavy chain H3-like [Bicyclus anynana]|uniref:Inter-alpha-trypsin inhibitor heavy chain H3-like n=1 Tax=Bicyclus anynana TaxID=110368 RepID=A0ABM3M7U9_BICAN|nr:inter-alpha-trypsin inhibitor heavy chain H3-like [Bicyclus anynana]